MSPKLTHLTHDLQSAGVSAAIVKLVQDDLAKKEIPPIKGDTARRLREVIGAHQKAVLVLCTNGHYKVFSPEGHDVLRESAHKHKPWVLAAKKSASDKH